MTKSTYPHIKVSKNIINYDGYKYYMEEIYDIDHVVPFAFGREHLKLRMSNSKTIKLWIQHHPNKRQIVKEAYQFHSEYWNKIEEQAERKQLADEAKQLKRSLSQSGPESLVVEYVVQILTRELGYRIQDIEKEFHINMGSSRKRLDIVVFKYGYAHEQQNIVLIVECKKGSHNDTKGLARDQLYSYMSATGSAKYGILATSIWQVFEKVQDNTLIQIPNAPASNNTFVAVSYNPPKQFEPIPIYLPPTLQNHSLPPLPDNRLERDRHYKQSSYSLKNVVSIITGNNVLTSVSIVSMIVIPMICINVSITGIRNLAKSFEPTATSRIQIFAVDTSIPLNVIQADLTQNPAAYTSTDVPIQTTPTSQFVGTVVYITRTPIATLRPTSTRTLTATLRPTSTRTPSPTIEPDVFGRVGVGSQDRINLRANPSTTARILDTIFPGTQVKILDESDDGNWLEVELEDGQTGWVSSALVTLEP